MKNLLILIATCSLSLGVSAQEHKMEGIPNKNQNMEKKAGEMDMKKDHVMMMDGKMSMIVKGKKAPMNKDMTMANGTKVMKDGSFKMKSGKTMQMKEGDMMDMNGNMGKMPAKKKSKSAPMKM